VHCQVGQAATAPHPLAASEHGGARAGSSQWRDFSGQLLALFDALTEAADQGHRIGGLLEVRPMRPTAACAASAWCPALLVGHDPQLSPWLCCHAPQMWLHGTQRMPVTLLPPDAIRQGTTE